MARTIVGILRGGTSSEYDLSLKTGARMLSSLPEERYDVRDVFIDKRGIWHLRGLPVAPARALQQVDVVLNALHGGMGEDGTVQRFLDVSGVPYAGTKTHGASNSINKIRAHEILENAGVRMPAYVAFSVLDTLNTAQMAKTVFAAFGPPYVVKPPREGSSNGLRIVDTLIDLPDVIGDALDAYGSVLIEQFVSGEEVSAGVIEGFRNQELYVLPPAHVRLPVGDRTIESHHHHDASTRIIVPSRFSNTDKRHMEDMARTAHTMLAMSHFSYANMIKTPRATYLLDVDAVPGLYEGAPFPAMLESVGSSVADFLEHSIRLARMPR